MVARRGRPGAALLAVLAVGLLQAPRFRLEEGAGGRGGCFVSGPSAAAAARQRPPQQLLARRVSTSLPETTPTKEPEATAGAPGASNEKDIDDAVLRMAMAMAEEEDGVGAKTVEKKEESGFDFNILVTAFWSVLIVYSFGSSFIGITQGRIQDRTGGDFTAYDFFDNIFAFKEWSWETSLGFNPIEAFEKLAAGKQS